jgi:site-specific recombinase XerD
MTDDGTGLTASGASDAVSGFPAAADFARVSQALDGRTGRNRARGGVAQIAADSDVAAIEACLAAKRGRSAHTLRAYRREAYRLYAWAIAFRAKALSDLALEDVEAYHAWLAAPAAHPSWVARGWTLFRVPLSLASQAQALTVCQGIFAWLVDAGYLAGNPFKLYDGGRAAQAQQEVRERAPARYLPRPLWDWLVSELDALRPLDNRGGRQSSYERQRFLLLFLYWTGLRRTELATAMMAGFRREGGVWTLDVRGKGRVLEEPIVVLAPAMATLVRYRLARGLAAEPSRAELDVPLVARLGDGEAITDHFLNAQVKALLGRAAERCEAEHPEWAERLGAATAHWLRHSFVTHSAEAGVPIESVADQVRHRSLDTTRRVYRHVDARRRRIDLDRLR